MSQAPASPLGQASPQMGLPQVNLHRLEALLSRHWQHVTHESASQQRGLYVGKPVTIWRYHGKPLRFMQGGCDRARILIPVTVCECPRGKSLCTFHAGHCTGLQHIAPFKRPRSHSYYYVRTCATDSTPSLHLPRMRWQTARSHLGGGGVVPTVSSRMQTIRRSTRRTRGTSIELPRAHACGERCVKYHTPFFACVKVSLLITFT